MERRTERGVAEVFHSLHPEERRRRVFKDVVVMARFILRDGAARLLTMRTARALLGTWMLVVAPPASAEEEPTFRIEFKDGAVAPALVEVPAGRRFRLELVNVGLSPIEFESTELRKEKVVPPGATSVLVIRTLDAGEYAFFDDFHPGAAAAKLVAK